MYLQNEKKNALVTNRYCSCRDASHSPLEYIRQAPRSVWNDMRISAAVVGCRDNVDMDVSRDAVLDR